MTRYLAGLAALAALVACGDGNPFTDNSGGTTSTAADIPAAIAGDLDSINFNAATNTLTVTGLNQDGSPVANAYSPADMTAGVGIDVMDGGGGRDELVVNEASQGGTLIGGSGFDTFVFKEISGVPSTFNVFVERVFEIPDYDRDLDEFIDLSAIDPDPNTPGDQAFVPGSLEITTSLVDIDPFFLDFRISGGNIAFGEIPDFGMALVFDSDNTGKADNVILLPTLTPFDDVLVEL